MKNMICALFFCAALLPACAAYAAEVTDAEYIEYNVKLLKLQQKYKNNPAGIIKEMENLNKEYNTDSKDWLNYITGLGADRQHAAEVCKKIAEDAGYETLNLKHQTSK